MIQTKIKNQLLFIAALIIPQLYSLKSLCSLSLEELNGVMLTATQETFCGKQDSPLCFQGQVFLTIANSSGQFNFQFLSKEQDQSQKWLNDAIIIENQQDNEQLDPIIPSTQFRITVDYSPFHFMRWCEISEVNDIQIQTFGFQIQLQNPRQLEYPRLFQTLKFTRLVPPHQTSSYAMFISLAPLSLLVTICLFF